MRARCVRMLVVVALWGSAAAGCAWFDDERAAIRRRLQALTERVNASAPEGLGSVGRAAEIGGYFTADVVVELGDGSTPIEGRETLMGMAMRLQPRLAEFRVSFEDANVRVADDEQTADVTLTAGFVRREPTARQSMDAREFRLGLRKVDGEWQIARVTAIDTLK